MTVTGAASSLSKYSLIRQVGANLLLTLGVVLAIAVIDAWQATTIVRGLSAISILRATFLLSFLAVVPLTVFTAPIGLWARPRRIPRLVVAFIEGGVIAGLVFLVEGYDSVSRPVLWVLAGGAVFGRVFFAWIRQESKWIVAAKCILIVLCLFVLVAIPWRQKPIMRVTLDVTIAMAVSSLFLRQVVRLPSWLCYAPVIVATGLAVIFGVRLRKAENIRASVLESTTQAKATLELLIKYCPQCIGKRHDDLGVRRCRNLTKKSCFARELTENGPLSGMAKGADVLLISFDSLRADYLAELTPLFGVLGETAKFRNAYSTAPGTRLAFGSIWRGRPVRRVPFNEKILFGGVSVSTASMTLATAMRAQGYRAAMVVPQRFFNPAAGLSTGFELAYVDPNQIPLDAEHQELKVVSFSLATAHALKVFPGAVEPLLVWLHAFETHYPYGAGKAENQSRYRKAVRQLVPEAIDYVTRFRASRKGRPLVVVIFGDHGEEFGEHGGRHHSSTVFREQTQVVLVMSGPGLGAATVERPVSLAAIPATLMDWLGLEIPCDFDIPSILGCVGNPSKCPKVVESSTPRTGGLYAYTSEAYRILVNRGASLETVYSVERDRFDQDPLQPSDVAFVEEFREFRRNIESYDRMYCSDTEMTGGD